MLSICSEDHVLHREKGKNNLHNNRPLWILKGVSATLQVEDTPFRIQGDKSTHLRHVDYFINACV